MGNVAVQLLGFFLALLGLTGTLVAIVLPHWRHTAYFTSNLITATSYMKGLWMECVTHTTGIYQCEVHRSMLSLPLDLQAARALMVLSSTISTVATIISAFGMTCTRCLQHSPAKVTLAVSGGVCFISAGILCLITASWTASDVIRDAYDPFSTSGMKYQVGLCVYIGFASAVFSMFGGGVLSAACWDSSDSSPYKLPGLKPGHLPTGRQMYTVCESCYSSRQKSSSSTAGLVAIAGPVPGPVAIAGPVPGPVAIAGPVPGPVAIAGPVPGSVAITGPVPGPVAIAGPVPGPVAIAGPVPGPVAIARPVSGLYH